VSYTETAPDIAQLPLSLERGAVQVQQRESAGTSLDAPMHASHNSPDDPRDLSPMTFETLTHPRADAVWGALAQHVRPCRTRDLPVEQALGCVLAHDALSEIDYPPYERAVMDGYALRAADVPAAAVLRVIGLAAAGGEPCRALHAGECVQVNTGAVIPEGADAVVPVENTRTISDTEVEINETPRAGQHIEHRGGIRARGSTLVPAGVRMMPATLAALVAGGVGKISVYARPRVALLTTCTELAERGARLAPGQIHDTNSIALSQQIARAGGEVHYQGRCADKPSDLHAALELGLAHDVLVVTGGMSKGTHDLVPSLLERLGVEWLVNGLDLKPGKPTRIGRSRDGCWVLGLPGNPVSCAVCFVLFGGPLLAGLQGLIVRPPPSLTGLLEEEMPANGSRPMFQPSMWRSNGMHRVYVRPVEWRGSGDPFGLAMANALIYRPANAPSAPEGEPLSFIMLDLPQG
jgi:molybdopterin molybdotransferase